MAATVLIFIGLTGQAAEDSGSEPAQHAYAKIPLRNAFGIKPPVVNPTETAPPPPPPPPPKVDIYLTGISVFKSHKQAYLVSAKQAGKQPEYLTVDEGYDVDGLKVMNIDVKRQTVKVSNNGTEVTLNFKDNGMKGGGAPGAPGGAPPGTMPPGMRPIPQPIPTAANGLPPGGGPGAGPTIIPRGGSRGAGNNTLPQSGAINPSNPYDLSGSQTVRDLPTRTGAVYVSPTTTLATPTVTTDPNSGAGRPPIHVPPVRGQVSNPQDGGVDLPPPVPPQ
jgi:hypothetical protein